MAGSERLDVSGFQTNAAGGNETHMNQEEGTLFRSDRQKENTSRPELNYIYMVMNLRRIVIFMTILYYVSV